MVAVSASPVAGEQHRGASELALAQAGQRLVALVERKGLDFRLYRNRGRQRQERLAVGAGREGCLEVLVGASIGQVEISLDCLFSCGAVPSALDQNRVNGFSVFRPET